MINVSVVTFKSPSHEVQRLISVAQRSDLVDTLFIINNSTFWDKTITLTRKCTLIQRPDNPGYGAGHNVALRESMLRGTPYHLVVNADVDFDADCLTKLLVHMKSNPNTGLVSPLICNMDGTDQRVYKLLPTPVDLAARLFGIKLSGSKDIAIRDFDHNMVVSAPYMSGAFMLLRSSAIAECGYFDERFFMYPEDIDLTRRIFSKFDCQTLRSVRVRHEHGAASKKSVVMLWVHVKNICVYFFKWGWFYDPERSNLNSRARQLNEKRSQQRVKF